MGVDIGPEELRDSLKLLMKKTIDHKVAQYISLIPSMTQYAEKMKMKLFSGILPSLVNQYHDESFFDVKLNPSDFY